jgi:hypothetical protein
MEWWRAIQGCKEDGKNKKIDEDKKGVARQKQGMFYVMANSVFCLELGLIKGWCWKLMTLKGGMSCRIRGMWKTASVGVWEELTWVIKWVNHNTGVGAKNLFVGILGIGQSMWEGNRMEEITDNIHRSIPLIKFSPLLE